MRLIDGVHVLGKRKDKAKTRKRSKIDRHHQRRIDPCPRQSMQAIIPAAATLHRHAIIALNHPARCPSKRGHLGTPYHKCGGIIPEQMPHYSGQDALPLGASSWHELHDYCGLRRFRPAQTRTVLSAPRGARSTAPAAWRPDRIGFHTWSIYPSRSQGVLLGGAANRITNRALPRKRERCDGQAWKVQDALRERRLGQSQARAGHDGRWSTPAPPVSDKAGRSIKPLEPTSTPSSASGACSVSEPRAASKTSATLS